MKLTVIDTPGFGDQINNENWWVLQGRGLVSQNGLQLRWYMEWLSSTWPGKGLENYCTQGTS